MLFFTARVSMEHYAREAIVGLQLWLSYASLYFVTYLNAVSTKAAVFVFFRSSLKVEHAVLSLCISKHNFCLNCFMHCTCTVKRLVVAVAIA